MKLNFVETVWLFAHYTTVLFSPKLVRTKKGMQLCLFKNFHLSVCGLAQGVMHTEPPCLTAPFPLKTALVLRQSEPTLYMLH